MRAKSPPVKAIADAYGISRQRLHVLRKTYQLTDSEITDPEQVFERLLESGRRGKTRTLLSNPIARGLIAEQIDLAAIRQTPPSTQNKIESIH
jgi:hypothetical protein